MREAKAPINTKSGTTERVYSVPNCWGSAARTAKVLAQPPMIVYPTPAPTHMATATGMRIAINANISPMPTSPVSC